MKLSELSQLIEDFQNDYDNSTIVLNLSDEAESNILEIYGALAKFCDDREDEITQEIFNKLLAVCNSAMSEMDDVESVHTYFESYFEILAVSCGLSMSDNNNNQVVVQGFGFEETMQTYASDNLEALIAMSGLEGMDVELESRPEKKQKSFDAQQDSFIPQSVGFAYHKGNLFQQNNLDSLLNSFIGKMEREKLTLTQVASENKNLLSMLPNSNSLEKLLKCFSDPAKVEVVKMIGMEKIQSIYKNSEEKMGLLLDQLSEISVGMRLSRSG